MSGSHSVYHSLRSQQSHLYQRTTNKNTKRNLYYLLQYYLYRSDWLNKQWKKSPWHGIRQRFLSYKTKSTSNERNSWETGCHHNLKFLHFKLYCWDSEKISHRFWENIYKLYPIKACIQNVQRTLTTH